MDHTLYMMTDAGRHATVGAPQLPRSPIGGARSAVELDPVAGIVWVRTSRSAHEPESGAKYLPCATADEVAGAIRGGHLQDGCSAAASVAYALVLISRAEGGAASAFLLAHGAAGRILSGLCSELADFDQVERAVARMARRAAEVAYDEAVARAESMQLEAEAIHRAMVSET